MYFIFLMIILKIIKMVELLIGEREILILFFVNKVFKLKDKIFLMIIILYIYLIYMQEILI